MEPNAEINLSHLRNNDIEDVGRYVTQKIYGGGGEVPQVWGRGNDVIVGAIDDDVTGLRRTQWLSPGFYEIETAPLLTGTKALNHGIQAFLFVRIRQKQMLRLIQRSAICAFCINSDPIKVHEHNYKQSLNKILRPVNILLPRRFDKNLLSSSGANKIKTFSKALLTLLTRTKAFCRNVESKFNLSEMKPTYPIYLTIIILCLLDKNSEPNLHTFKPDTYGGKKICLSRVNLSLSKYFRNFHLMCVVLMLLILAGIEQNPGPKMSKQTTLETSLDRDKDIKDLINALTKRLDSWGERLESRLSAIDDRVENINQRLQQLEESSAVTKAALSQNSKKIKDLEDQLEHLDAKSRERNLIFYGIEQDNNEDCRERIRKVIEENMQTTEKINITRCHRLSRKPGAPILIEVPEQNDRLTLFKAALNLRGTKISLSKDYSMKMREQRRVLNVKRRELVEKAHPDAQVHGMHLFRRPTASSAARGTGTANADIDQSRRPTKKRGRCKQSQNHQSRVHNNQVKPETPQPSRLFETKVGTPPMASRIDFELLSNPTYPFNHVSKHVPNECKHGLDQNLSQRARTAHKAFTHGNPCLHSLPKPQIFTCHHSNLTPRNFSRPQHIKPPRLQPTIPIMPKKVSVHRHSSPTYHTKSTHDHTSPRHNHANVPHNIHARQKTTTTNKRNTRANRRQRQTSACTTVKNNTIIPSTQNIEKIHATKQPHNRKTLRSFLKAVNAYKEFIPDHARLRTPLINLLKKDVMWVWSDECQKAFTNLKESLTTHPTLYLYQEGLPCQVHCNTSTFGIAGILKQVYPDGKTYPVQHFSRSLRGHERNYSDLELQCLAIVESVDNFRACLMGRKFTILSDHPALQWLKEIKAPSGRLFRWRLRLSRYEYEVRSINGVQQYETGVVTRIPFCGFLDAPLIKSQQSSPPGKSRVTMDHNKLRTVSRKGVLKTIVPSSLTARLLKSVHTQHHHPNISKMTRLISSQYYWQNMTQDIAKQEVKMKISHIRLTFRFKHPRISPSHVRLGVLDRLRFLPIKKMDQRTCIKFCVKNEIKCADAFRMLTVAYGEATLDRSNVYRWYKMFSEGREDVNNEKRAGRPSTSTTDEKNE
ncbi:K02A2.6-like [Cordylochernes scorpioides]|uniref:RNA-directed DNA polymerase n=1 Tax=Cordylochernes scorpioides TaxID=51811 RepID=A0ABY6KEZ6_9ARAC|nr:K02A2.6-like [Cordylochernes scorpioides]